MPRKKSTTTPNENITDSPEHLEEQQDALPTGGAELSESELSAADASPPPDPTEDYPPAEDPDDGYPSEEELALMEADGANDLHTAGGLPGPADIGPAQGCAAPSGEEMKGTAFEQQETDCENPRGGEADAIPNYDTEDYNLEDYPSADLEDADGPQYDQLLHEVGSSTPLMMEDNASISLDVLMSGSEPPEPELPPAAVTEDTPSPAQSPRRRSAPGSISLESDPEDYVLTIEARAQVETEQDREELIWHELRTSHITNRILSGILAGVEQTESGMTLAIVDYHGFRVAIPAKEMMLNPGPVPYGAAYSSHMERLSRIMVTMLGAEIDFIVRGLDRPSRSVVASRKAAMLRKRQTFYMDTNDAGKHMIYEGRIVQARVIGVAEKVVRIEAFGVECPIFARDLSSVWLGDARDKFSVGDRVLVRILTINRADVHRLTITADMRSISTSTNLDNLKLCLPQSRYVGRVTDVRYGVIYIRLNNGVNAIAHTCHDRRMPGKKDDVSFAVTKIDEERGIAVGIITRIIKQNL